MEGGGGRGRVGYGGGVLSESGKSGPTTLMDKIVAKKLSNYPKEYGS